MGKYKLQSFSNDKNQNAKKYTTEKRESRKSPSLFIQIESSDIQIQGYKLNWLKFFVTWFLICLSLGSLGLILFWKYDWYVKCTHSVCPLSLCTKVLVLDSYGKLFVENVTELAGNDGGNERSATKQIKTDHKLNKTNTPTGFFEVPLKGALFAVRPTVRLFRNKRSTYLYSPQTASFYDIREWLAHGFPVNHVTHYLSKGVVSNSNSFQSIPSATTDQDTDVNGDAKRPGPPASPLQRIKRLLIFGPNDLYIPVPGFFKIMYDEVVTPFYAFQAFSVILWYVDDYWFYASCVLIISILTLLKSTFDIRKERMKLSQKLSSYTTNTLKANKTGRQTGKNKRITNTNELEKTVLVERYNPSTGKFKELEACPISQVVPGDILNITLDYNLTPSGKSTGNGTFNVPCDAVILSGSCVTDECMLTGESVPVVKTPLNPSEHCALHESSNPTNTTTPSNTSTPHNNTNQFGNLNNLNNKDVTTVDTDMHLESGLLYFDKDPTLARNMIYNGTRILQIRSQEQTEDFLNHVPELENEINNVNNVTKAPSLRAYVISTGFNTAKGKMVIDFLYPAPSLFRFDQDSFKFITALFCISLVGFVYSVTLKIVQHVPFRQIVIRSLDLIAIVVPPALPAAMTAGLIFAQKRLKREHGVLCLSPEKINASGALDVLCFDKTGTLTEDGLDILGVLPVVKGGAAHNSEVNNSNTAGDAQTTGIKTTYPPSTHFCKTIVTDFESSFDADHNEETLETGVASKTTSLTELSVCCALCQSLAKIGDELMGDPLETKMFKFSDWSFSDELVQSSQKRFSLAYNCTIADSIWETDNASKHYATTYPLPLSSPNNLTISGVITPPGYIPKSKFPDASPVNNKQPELSSATLNEELAFLLATNPMISHQYGIIHQFPFMPSLQRMSVIVRRLFGSHFELYAKGSPEVIYSLCRPDTLPLNFSRQLDEMTNNGCRVIACARKTLKHFKLTGLKKNSRKDLEKDLDFLGFLVFQNKLKPQSQPTMDVLNDAGFKNVMVTGDNLLTAISVARNCHLIPISTKLIYIVEASIENFAVPTTANNTGSLPPSITLQRLTLNLTEKPLLDSSTLNIRDIKSHMDSSEETTEEMIDKGSSNDFVSYINRKLCQLKYLWCSDDKDTNIDSEKFSKITSSNGYASDSNAVKRGLLNHKTGGGLFDPHTFYNRVRDFICTASMLKDQSSSTHACNTSSHITTRLENGQYPTRPTYNGTGQTAGRKCSTLDTSNPVCRDKKETLSYNNDVFYAMTGTTFEILDTFPHHYPSNDGSTSPGRHFVNEVRIYVRPTKINNVSPSGITGRLVYQKVYGGGLNQITDGNNNNSILNESHQSSQVEIDMISQSISNDSSQVSLLRTSRSLLSPSSCNLRRDSNHCDKFIGGSVLNTKMGEGDLLDSILIDGCSVFARMSPEAKTRLIGRFQKLDYYVGMCGDGANDCGALKAAHMGVSLATSSVSPSSIDEQQEKIDLCALECSRPNATKSHVKFAKLREFLTKRLLCGSCHTTKAQHSSSSLGETQDDEHLHFASGNEGTASLAASFTAIHGNISCLPGMIREGRASLTTSFGVFKNMACYSLNQFVACLSLYWFGTNFSDVQFTLADVFPATILSMLMGNTKAYPRLPKVNTSAVKQHQHHRGTRSSSSKKNSHDKCITTVQQHRKERVKEFEKYKPDTSLALARHVGSVLGHVVINISFLGFAISYTLRQPWCTRDVVPIIDFKNPLYPHLVAAVFFITFFQYVGFTVIFSRGPPFRRSYFTNIPLLAITIVCIAFCTYLILREPLTYPAISRLFKLHYPPANSHLTYLYLVLALVNFLVSLSFEKVLLDRLLYTVSRKRDLFLRPIKRPAHVTLQTFTQKFGLNTLSNR